jgi:long-chain fatty acid transport protein
MNRVAIVFIGLVLTLAPTFASAGGFRVEGQSNSAFGMANAVTADVDDASAVYFNPARMVFVGEYAAQVGVLGIDPTVTYSGHGHEVEAAGNKIAIPHIYVMKSFNEQDMAVGLGLFQEFANSTTWPNNGPFASTTVDTQFNAYALGVNVAKRFGDHFSIGAGANYLITHGRWDNTSGGGESFDGNGGGFNFNVAMAYSIGHAIHLGATYRSAASISLDGDYEQKGAAFTSTGTAETTLPAIATLGVAWAVTEQFVLGFDLDWTDWAAYEEVKFSLDNALNGTTDSAIHEGYESDLGYRLGAAFHASHALTLRAGVILEKAPNHDSHFNAMVPDTDHTTVTFGLTYLAADNFHVDGSLGYTPETTRTVDNTEETAGDYTRSRIFYGLSFGYKM